MEDAKQSLDKASKTNEKVTDLRAFNQIQIAREYRYAGYEKLAKKQFIRAKEYALEIKDLEEQKGTLSDISYSETTVDTEPRTDYNSWEIAPKKFKTKEGREKFVKESAEKIRSARALGFEIRSKVRRSRIYYTKLLHITHQYLGGEVNINSEMSYPAETFSEQVQRTMGFLFDAAIFFLNIVFQIFLIAKKKILG